MKESFRKWDWDKKKTGSRFDKASVNLIGSSCSSGSWVWPVLYLVFGLSAKESCLDPWPDGGIPHLVAERPWRKWQQEIVHWPHCIQQAASLSWRKHRLTFLSICGPNSLASLRTQGLESVWIVPPNLLDSLQIIRYN